MRAVPVLLLLVSCGGDDDGATIVDGNTTDGAGTIDTPVDAPGVPGLSIVFDYRYDDAGFFTPAHEAVLEEAARRWDFVDELPDIPLGTQIRTRDPELPNNAAFSFDSDVAIEDVLIFVGCSAIDGPGGSTALSNNAAAINTVADTTLREQLRMRYEGPVFEPWTGWISFDCGENWFVDPTPATDGDVFGQLDFLSVAMHEVGHVLGFGTAMAFATHVNATPAFTGTAATTAHGGPVPMQAGGIHFTSGLSSDGREPVMDPGRSAGQRTPPTTLDRAAMSDLGYQPRSP